MFGREKCVGEVHDTATDSEADYYRLLVVAVQKHFFQNMVTRPFPLLENHER
jgi:hypothetical protein